MISSITTSNRVEARNGDDENFDKTTIRNSEVGTKVCGVGKGTGKNHKRIRSSKKASYEKGKIGG